jgi:hypothetical protein
MPNDASAHSFTAPFLKRRPRALPERGFGHLQRLIPTCFLVAAGGGKRNGSFRVGTGRKQTSALLSYGREARRKRATEKPDSFLSASKRTLS